MSGQGAQLYDVGGDRLPATAALDRATDRSLVERITGEAWRLALAVVTSEVDGELLLTAGFGTRVRHGRRLVQGPEPLWERPVEKVLVRSRHSGDAGLAAPAVRVCGYLIAVMRSGGHSRTTVRGLATAAADVAAVFARTPWRPALPLPPAQHCMSRVHAPASPRTPPTPAPPYARLPGPFPIGRHSKELL
ncbi:hypothetical protein [Streptomyces sp. NPDC057336]|uniref:hypothetical protein n=1 Tax=Streptomyces sp. NPDC057336 TaxID=3346102 RepID=UPI0036378462